MAKLQGQNADERHLAAGKLLDPVVRGGSNVRRFLFRSISRIAFTCSRQQGRRRSIYDGASPSARSGLDLTANGQSTSSQRVPPGRIPQAGFWLAQESRWLHSEGVETKLPTSHGPMRSSGNRPLLADSLFYASNAIADSPQNHEVASAEGIRSAAQAVHWLIPGSRCQVRHGSLF